MSEQRTKPEVAGEVFDAVKGNWVDRFAPQASRPYLRLSRADRPIGTWLLLFPCWWGLFFAILADGQFALSDVWIFVGCGLGAFLMRGDGCTWNDITDRKFDGAVERTKSRPIPSGQVSVKSAVIWMGAQVALAACILFSFNAAAIICGIIALIPVAIYPFAKRFTWWPQVFLGLAFNWGVLLAFIAHQGGLQVSAVILYLSGICWTLFYDTIYAHQDIEDDALIGIKSTARLFGAKTWPWLLGFALTSGGLMLGALALQAQGPAFWVAGLGVAAFVLHMMWQLRQFRLGETGLLLRLFRANSHTGFLPVVFFGLAIFLY